MSSWFGQKQATTPGGSVIQTYDNTPPKRDLRWLDDASPDDIQSREAAYERLFGERVNVSHESTPKVPHINVNAYKRNFYTLVTSGMSDLPMNLDPQAVGKSARRVELVFYCAGIRPEYIETLRWLAHFPHDYQTWVGHGHTIPNGSPSAPMWSSRNLDTVLLMPTIVKPDNGLREHLTIQNDPVELLWVVPLSKAECDLKLAKGFPAILDLFERNHHSHIFNPDRDSYC